MEIGVIGAGECFREKVLPALFKMGNFSLNWIVDVLPADTVRKSLVAAGLPDKFKYFSAYGFLEELPGGYVDAILDTSPSRYHAHNLCLAIDSGKNIYVEKPFAISLEDIRKVEGALGRNLTNFAYFAEYYRDEKGLGIRALTDEIQAGDWYEKFIEPGVDSSMSLALDSMGKILKIDGVCLEGQGKKAGIGHRPWVGDKDQGGQLLDMSTHLLSDLYLLKDRLGDISLARCVTGVCKEAKEEYESKFRREIAETYAELALTSSSGCNINFKLGKYTGVAQRWLHIRGENGYVFVDFETQQMDVKTPACNRRVRVNSDPKYSIIMQDFKRRLGNSGDYMFDNSKETLKMILKARGNVDESFLYRSGDLTPIVRL